MKKFSFLLVTLLSLMSCSEERDLSGFGTLQIVINASYGGVPLFLGNSYDYFGNGSVKFTKAEFFLSQLTAIGESSAVVFKDVDYVSILAHNLTLQDALDGLTLNYLVPGGFYKGISFNIGVTPAQNKTKPVDYSPSSPLGEGTHYWAGWNSYIFSKIEGVLDTGGAKTYDLGFAIHTGTDECLATLTVTKNFTISEEQTTGLGLDLDVRRVFQDNGQFFNLANSPLNHNPANIGVLKLFAASLAQAIQIKN